MIISLVYWGHKIKDMQWIFFIFSKILFISSCGKFFFSFFFKIGIYIFLRNIDKFSETRVSLYYIIDGNSFVQIENNIIREERIINIRDFEINL